MVEAHWQHVFVMGTWQEWIKIIYLQNPIKSYLINSVLSKKLHLLDVTVSLIEGVIETDLYVKPADRH